MKFFTFLEFRTGDNLKNTFSGSSFEANLCLNA